MEPPSFFNITSITLLWEWSDSNFSQTTSIFLNVLGMSRISYHLKGCRGGYGVCFHYGVAWLSPSYMSVSNPGKAGNVVWKMCAVMCMWKCVGECVCVCIYRERCQPWRGHARPGAHVLWPPLPTASCHIDLVSITTVEGTIKGWCGCVVYRHSRDLDGLGQTGLS